MSLRAQMEPGLMEATFKILDQMQRNGVISKYAIGGAVGAIFYIEPFLTYDLDVFVLLPETRGGLLSLSPIYDFLKERGCTEEGECILIEGFPVQFLPAHNALLQEALTEALEKQYHSTTVRVFRPEHLLAVMLQTGRDKDRQRFSTFMREALLDPDYLRDVLNRHHLTETFNRWKAKN